MPGLDAAPGDLARAVAARRGLPPSAVVLLPQQGVATWAYALGDDLVLRVARPGCEDDLAREAVVVPAAAAAGLPVAEVVERGPAGPGAPLHLVQRRCRGVRLDSPDLPVPVRRAGHEHLGRWLRRLHDADLDVPDGVLPTDDGADARATAAGLAAGGWVGDDDARWLLAWSDHLEGRSAGSAESAETAHVVVHGDAAASNVLVDPGTGEVTALLDWGDTARADPAADLAKVRPVHLPEAVRGYAGRPEDEQRWAARALRHHLAWALGRLATPPRPGDPTWSAPPASRLLGLVELLRRAPAGPWTGLLRGGR